MSSRYSVLCFDDHDYDFTIKYFDDYMDAKMFYLLVKDKYDNVMVNEILDEN
jgi:hypothetical protein